MPDKPDNIDEQIKERLLSIFPSEQVAKKVIQMATSPNPPHLSPKSYLPYYKKSYGEWIQKYVDMMIEKREAGTIEPLLFQYSVFCSGPDAMTERTLYAKINQAIKFLVEQMDTVDRKYEKWRSYVKIEVMPETGVRIKYDATLVTGTSSATPEPVFVQKEEDKFKWEKQIDDYLEGASVEPLVIKGVLLTPDEIARQKLRLAGLKNVLFDITPTSISIIKIN